jgi:hypothetical protein
MPNVLSIPVPNGSSAVVWASRNPGVSTLLFVNPDLVNTVYVGSQSNITPTSPNVVPILPNGTFSGDAQENWYVTGAAAGIAPLVVVPNGQAYFLGITAGLGKLVIPQVQSPNFVTGVSGWIIRKDGSAEFNNVVIRDGEIISGTNLYYSGPPAFGNLIAAITPLAGTDPYGNTYPGGILGEITTNLIDFLYGGAAAGSLAPVMLSGGVALDLQTLPFNSTAGTAANPTIITTDTWHPLGAMAGGSGYTVNNARYQLTTDGRYEVDINLTAGAATAAGTYAFPNALPVGQRPPFACSYPLGWNGTTAAGVNTATLRISTAGIVSLQLPVLPNSTVVSATQRVPTS